MNVNFLARGFSSAMVFWVLFASHVTAQSQPTAALDAQSPGAAIGIMKSTLLTIGVMTSRCKTLFPATADKIDAELSTWNQAEAHVISTTNAHWLVKIAEEPQLNTIAQYSADTISKQVDSILNTPGGHGKSVLGKVCDNYFSQLNTGALRRRTPKVFEFIDQMK
ncbi:hypothetical protein [Massilia sp. TWP1-3-3]|uniref:hypothetical protein n=1 Tax=Massilia sp. TWP1-3-3 TaxID=2804573 RepID=UPI003CEBA825